MDPIEQYIEKVGTGNTHHGPTDTLDSGVAAVAHFPTHPSGAGTTSSAT